MFVMTQNIPLQCNIYVYNYVFKTEFYMELSQKAVYPVHKLDVVSNDCVAHEICNDKNCVMEVSQRTTTENEELIMLDYCINPHYVIYHTHTKQRKIIMYIE